jgi:hypothetical protein
MLLLAMAPTPLAFADAGVFTGNGQNLHQITSKTIQLVNIDVTIVLGRGPFLFDGGVPGMDRAEYQCTFLLRSLSDNAEDVEVGFPVDSEFAQRSAEPSSSDSKEWVLEYGFIARDKHMTYHVEFVRRKPNEGPGEFGSIFVWRMHFAPKEDRTLTVQYRIPMSMGLVSTQKAENSSRPGSAALSQELMDIAQLEMAGYVTSTGSSWARDVESATFTVYTQAFERYLGHRGLTEASAAKMNAEETAQFRSSFPVLHPWWFRQIKPSGWKEVRGGVQWSYKDFKPKDLIDIRYYMTELPLMPDEVDAFVDRFLKAVGPKESTVVELGRLKEILLATYGKEPNDEMAKAFASAQLWYAPQHDFSMAHLSETQQAVLGKLDARIEAARRAQGHPGN